MGQSPSEAPGCAVAALEGAPGGLDGAPGGFAGGVCALAAVTTAPMTQANHEGGCSMGVRRF